MEENNKLAHDFQQLLAQHRHRAAATQQSNQSLDSSEICAREKVEMIHESRSPVQRMSHFPANTSVVGTSTTATSTAIPHNNAPQGQSSQHAFKLRARPSKKEAELARAVRVQVLRTATLRRTATQTSGRISKSPRLESKDDIELVDGTHTATERRSRTYGNMATSGTSATTSRGEASINSSFNQGGSGSTSAARGNEEPEPEAIDILHELGYIGAEEIKHVFDARPLVLDDGVALTVDLARKRWDKRMLATRDDETEGEFKCSVPEIYCALIDAP